MKARRYNVPAKRGPRPGFGPRKPSRGFPLWIVAVVAIVVIAAVATALALGGRLSPDASATPTSATASPRPGLTHTPLPTVTPTPTTIQCTVTRNTFARSEPDENSAGQGLSQRATINVIDLVENEGVSWYRAMLPGYSLELYVPAADVDCD